MLRTLAILAPCSLLLGLASGEKVWSQVEQPSLVRLAPAPTRSQSNWNSFWQHHLGQWKGSWTRYTPSGAIKETFASSRTFSADPALRAGLQVNRYRYADGRRIRKEWSFNAKDHSLPTGFAHPAHADMRGLALDNGSAAWLIPTLQPHQPAPFELFLLDGDIRHSVGVVYGKNGRLFRTASIREQRGNPSRSAWTNVMAQGEPWVPKGRWQGEQRGIRADLSRSSLRPSTWQWQETKLSTHYLPDGIILRCPDQLVNGQPFKIRVIWLVDESQLQTITASYDSNAHLIAVTHQLLAPDS